MKKITQTTVFTFLLALFTYAYADSPGTCEAERAKVFWCKTTKDNCTSGASPSYSKKGDFSVVGCDCSCSWNKTAVNDPKNCTIEKNYPPLCDHNPGAPNCVTSDCRKCKDNKYYKYQYSAGSAYWILNRYSKQCPDN